MSHVVLIGDSIFDNDMYTGGGPDVVTHLRDALPPSWKATLQAVDGSVARSVEERLGDVPSDVSHLVLSAGGNDAISHMSILDQPARSTSEALMQLAGMADAFRRDYRSLLVAALKKGLPLAVCTIYDPRFPEPAFQRMAVTALAHFNDLILREAFAAGVPVVDLRLVCTESADYANEIEPSVQGGAKIAAAIAHLLFTHDFTKRRTEVFTG